MCKLQRIVLSKELNFEIAISNFYLYFIFTVKVHSVM